MFLKILLEPAIIFITICFIFFVIFILRNYIKIEKNLNAVVNFLQTINKQEVSYKFPQLDDFMKNNPYTFVAWEDFKKALIFPEKLYTATNKGNIDYNPEIYLTVDASYFFNEEALIHTKINHKFIQAMPTILTGLGPFFTFLKMALAFANVDLSSENATNSINILIGNIQVAALCSVFAVGYSLIFMIFEKVLYNKKCKKVYLLIQKELIRLFDVCTSEQFLLDIVKESKLQNFNNDKFYKDLPDTITKSITKSVEETALPYLENILYSLNKINENIAKSSGDDVVDKLF